MKGRYELMSCEKQEMEPYDSMNPGIKTTGRSIFNRIGIIDSLNIYL